MGERNDGIVTSVVIKFAWSAACRGGPASRIPTATDDSRSRIGTDPHLPKASGHRKGGGNRALFSSFGGGAVILQFRLAIHF